MPRIKRRAHRRKLAWGKGHTDQLLSGHGYSFAENFGNESRGTLDEDLMRSAWEELGAELLDGWIAENPFSRPYAWWRYAAPERRRRIGSIRLKSGRQRGGDDDDCEFIDDGKAHPFDSDERNTKIAEWRREYPEIADREAHRLNFGIPNSMMVPDDFDAVYESEHDYLERLGLLTPGEKSAVSRP